MVGVFWGSVVVEVEVEVVGMVGVLGGGGLVVVVSEDPD